MRTIEMKVYNYSELSEQAKQAVKSRFEYIDFWQQERNNSHNAAIEIYNRISYAIECRDLSGIRLYKWIINNILPELTSTKKYYIDTCNRKESYFSMSNKKVWRKERYSKIMKQVDAGNLTGYCDDYLFLEDLFNFLKNPIGVIEADLDSIYTKSFESDSDSFFEEEHFTEFMDANDYLFTEDGKEYIS